MVLKIRFWILEVLGDFTDFRILRRRSFGVRSSEFGVRSSLSSVVRSFVRRRSLSFVVVRCRSLSFVVVRRRSLSFVVVLRASPFVVRHSPLVVVAVVPLVAPSFILYLFFIPSVVRSFGFCLVEVMVLVGIVMYIVVIVVATMFAVPFV